MEAIMNRMEQQDFYNLLRCSRSLHDLILPYLYRSMILHEIRHRISTHSSQGRRVTRQRFSFGHLYQLLCHIVRRPTLAPHVRRVTTDEHRVAYDTPRGDDRQPIAVRDLDGKLH